MEYRVSDRVRSDAGRDTMKNKIINIILLLCVLVGIGILAYPFASNMLHDRKQDKIITEYDEQMENLADEEKEQMLSEARQYNEDLIGNVVLSDPFDPEALERINEDYDDLLNYNGDGIIGYVEIPRINVYEAIYHGTSDEVLAKGIGHLANTSLPVGGDGTHSVLSGHTGLPEAELFSNLEQMEEGDVFYIHVLGETLAYQTDQIKVVEPSDTSDLHIDIEHDYVTLVTCTPYGINSHRLLVRGTRIPYDAAAKAAGEAQAQEGMSSETWKEVYGKALLIGCLVAVAALLAIWLIVRKTTKSRKTVSAIKETEWIEQKPIRGRTEDARDRKRENRRSKDKKRRRRR
ncbi:MAG TPA: class C sortase [Candidatus Mediterraneibacter surreyensis]|nr:class C sortase [Candidatus Mediterraneibacter surreyensis]